MLILYYHELTRKIEEHEEKRYLMTMNILGKVLGKIEMVKDREKFDDAKILVDTDDKMLDEVTLKNILILILCVIKDKYDKFYP